LCRKKIDFVEIYKYIKIIIGGISLKKRSIFSGLIALSLFFSFSLGVLAAPKVSVWFNGKSKKVSVKIINKKAYVPLKDAVSWFGGKVTYDKKKNKYTVTSKGYKAPSKVKYYNVNVVKTSGPLKLTISKVTVDPSFKNYDYSTSGKVIVLDVKVQNTSSKIVEWYPGQGKFALNTGEQIEWAGDSDVDGKFLGNTVKSGKIILAVKNSNLDSVKSIQMNIDGAFDSNYNDLGPELLFTLKFK
jgi:lipopolysaccharide export system protein LptA